MDEKRKQVHQSNLIALADCASYEALQSESLSSVLFSRVLHRSGGPRVYSLGTLRSDASPRAPSAQPEKPAN